MEILEKIKKIESYKTWSISRKINSLLEIDANMYTNLGLDSTKKDITETKKLSRSIYKTIGKISPIDGFLLRALNTDIPEYEE